MKNTTDETIRAIKLLAENQQYILRQLVKIAEHLNLEEIRHSDCRHMEQMESILAGQIERLQD